MRNPFRRKKSAAPAATVTTDGRGWFSLIREAMTGNWQKGIEVRRDTVLAYHAVFSCIGLIAGDISKMPLLLKGQTSSGIWLDKGDNRLVPLLKKPNSAQTRIQFFEQWLTSKLAHGNTYALKIRDEVGTVTALRVLDPLRVLPLVAPDGSVYYQIQADDVVGLETSVTVPAREIIHDRFNCLFHPLVGLSPIFACGLSAVQGISIQENSALFFKNGGRPGGVITVPGNISEESAREIKAKWDASYSGENAGKTALVSNGATYKAVSVTAADAQVVEQLKLTSEIVCSTFHVPLYKVGLGEAPTYNNIEALDQQYYSQCLQTLIESIEILLAEGLSLDDKTRVEFDLGALLRMDTGTRFESHSKSINGGWMAPNEARRKENLPPVEGGESPYLQQQNYSLAALARRDMSDDPFIHSPVSAQQDGNKKVQDEIISPVRGELTELLALHKEETELHLRNVSETLIPQMVSEAVAALPPAQDGKSVTVDDVRPLLEGLVADAVSDFPQMVSEAVAATLAVQTEENKNLPDAELHVAKAMIRGLITK